VEPLRAWREEKHFGKVFPRKGAKPQSKDKKKGRGMPRPF